MVNISDFYKKEDKPESKKDIPKQEPAETKPAQEASSVFIPKEEIKKEIPIAQESISVPAKPTAGIIKENIKSLDKEKTKALYDECLELLKQIFQKAKNNEAIECGKIKEKVDSLVEQIALDNYYLLGLTTISTEDNYLLAHCINVCIISIVIGEGLGYDRRRLQELGLAALLYDIGMVKVMELSQKPGKLTEEEYKTLQEHPLTGAQFLGLSKDISSSIIYAAQQHHEQVNGKGYPKGLKGNQISEFAKIVAITDAYEALTHPRSHRERHNPYEALRELLKNKDRFDYHFFKIFIQQIGVYPIGSYIQLSSGEIGTVLKVNKQFVLRPLVRIDADAQGRRFEEGKIVDLAASPTLYIKKSIEEKK